nr:translation initiation factor IF-2-like [Macaca fascicularis]
MPLDQSNIEPEERERSHGGDRAAWMDALEGTRVKKHVVLVAGYPFSDPSEETQKRVIQQGLNLEVSDHKEYSLIPMPSPKQASKPNTASLVSIILALCPTVSSHPSLTPSPALSVRGRPSGLPTSANFGDLLNSPTTPSFDRYPPPTPRSPNYPFAAEAGGGQASRGRPFRGRRAGLGARSLPRRAGRGRVGQWLLQPGSCCSRSGGCCGPARAAPGLRADVLSRSAAAQEVAVAAVEVAPATARPGTAPELSNSCPRGASPPGRCPRTERLRAGPRPGEGRVPGARWARPARPRRAPAPLAWPRTPGFGLANATLARRSCDGLPSRDLRGTHKRGNEAGPFGGSLTLQSLPQHRCLKSRLSRRARTANQRRLRPDQGSPAVLSPGARVPEEIFGNGRSPKAEMPSPAMGRMRPILVNPE